MWLPAVVCRSLFVVCNYFSHFLLINIGNILDGHVIIVCLFIIFGPKIEEKGKIDTPNMQKYMIPHLPGLVQSL